ncbi:type II toxin-antitoxin system ParD family antitoxin [Candidatus Sumerlaeota bacterium]|nr:type II toxin-antitoxin system ParD family antitoxin [Candidatus Sumerlaeota bacterium]
MQKRSITIADDQEEFIVREVADGHYATASEVIRDGLRLLQQQKENRELKLNELRKEIQKGLDSLARGEGIPMEEAFAELDRRIALKRTTAKIKK